MSQEVKNSQAATKKAKAPQEILAPFYPENNNQASNSMQRFFVPGWNGESLISKHVQEFRTQLEIVHKDALRQLTQKVNFSKKLKQNFYEEFITYADYQAINIPSLDNGTVFWNELHNNESPVRDELDGFLNILAFRIAVIFILKARFIVILNQQSKNQATLKDIVYAHSFLNKYFRSASSTELKSVAFEQSIYSWYRPSDSIKNRLSQFAKTCLELSITDIIKTISTRSEKILAKRADYSHTMSHKHFGLFLNHILINFPIWLESISNKKAPRFKCLDDLEIISCKYIGDHLESLSLSHWLAQEANKHVHWEQVLCPDFKKEDFECGHYLRTINELQFLSFLAEISLIQGWDPKNYISNISNSHLSNRKNSSQVQRSIFNGDQKGDVSTYDRVILNLNKLPANNPHHFIITQLMKQLGSLKDEGFVFLLTPNKLFIPSQAQKIESLLKKLKLEGVFNFEGVKGKGEIGSYLYIFSKKSRLAPEYNFQKNTCYNFRINAELDTFQNFHNLTSLTREFFIQNFKDVPPLYQKQKQGFKFEFYQDAIVNGQLIHSSSKDTKNITHPMFFERLMGICQPLSFFYDIQQVEFGATETDENSLFNFSHSFAKETSQYSLVVDKRNREDIKIEMIETAQLEFISEQYGHALCSYFSIYPRWPQVSHHALADFLQSQIGRQIIHLTFSNELRKTKGNLSKLLIPAYFIESKSLPEDAQSALRLMNLSAQELLSLHPSEVEEKLAQCCVMMRKYAKDYPAAILEMTALFKKSVTKATEMIGLSSRQGALNFANPIFKTPLLLSKKYSIYPDNEDIYLEINSQELDAIHRPLTKTRKVKKEENIAIEFFSGEEKILSLYSEEVMIGFLEFLTQNVINYPIAQILQGIEVPRLDDLNAIFNAYTSQGKVFEGLTKQIPEEFNQLLSLTIFSGN